MKTLLRSLAVAALFLVAVTAYAVSKEHYGDLQLFTKVLNMVEQYYVEEVDTRKLIYGGIKGMLATLEPHSNFLPPKIFEEFKRETSGSFGGIGVEITLQNEYLTVITAIEDTPAFKAGIKAGDKIVEIEGESTKGISVSEAVSKMRGKKGTKVNISVLRAGTEKAQKFAIERENIKIKSIKPTDLGDGYLYVRITGFIDETGRNLKQVMDDFEKKNKKISGMIVDLRNNAGGLLDEAIQVSNLFIDEGPIVSTMGRNKADKKVFSATKGKARTEFKMIVLMNEYSASASEIVGGALQDSKRAVIMGARSFGKGSVQQVIDLGDGAGLKLTVSRYYTPSGRSIQATGIEPDISLENVDKEVLAKAKLSRATMREADMEGHLENELSAGIPDKKDDKKPAKELSPLNKLLQDDYQVQQAYNYLRAWTIFNQVGEPAKDAPKPTSEKPAGTTYADEIGYF